jgi:hypothetical protein
LAAFLVVRLKEYMPFNEKYSTLFTTKIPAGADELEVIDDVICPPTLLLGLGLTEQLGLTELDFTSDLCYPFVKKEVGIEYTV